MSMFTITDDKEVAEQSAVYDPTTLEENRDSNADRDYSGRFFIQPYKTSHDFARELNLEYLQRSRSTSHTHLNDDQFSEILNKTSDGFSTLENIIVGYINDVAQEKINKNLYTIINPSKSSASVLTVLIQVALHIGAHETARELASLAVEKYPRDQKIQDLANLLAPPKILASNLPADPKVHLNVQWIEQHGQDFRGQWIALENGELRGAAQTLDELIGKVGDPRKHGYLVTRV